MAARKYSASMDESLLAEIRADAGTEGMTVSAWLAEAAADRLRLKALRQVLDDWESEHGGITEAELDAADRRVREAARSRTGIGA